MSASKNLLALAKIIAQSEGECIIFVGAGLSRPLHYPSWGTMLEKIAELALSSTAFTPESKTRISGYITTKNEHSLFCEMSEIYRHCEAQYLNKLKDMFYPKEDAIKFLQAHSTLLTLLNKYIKGLITTNFDFCLEFARDEVGFNHITETSDIVNFMNNSEKQIFHMHGMMRNLSECVVCPIHYARLYTTEFIATVERILSKHTVLYLGTSLNDFELSRILERRASICLPANKSRFPDIKDHYAFVPRRTNRNPNEEQEAMLNQYKINVEHYDVLPGDVSDDYGTIDNHQALYDMIEELRSECEKYQIKSSVLESEKPLVEVKNDK